MNALLDTCALLALTRGELPEAATEALRSAPEACVSIVTAWEVAIKAAAGKLRLRESPLLWFQRAVEHYELRALVLDAPTACAAASLPPIHRDPFDRVLVALAQTHGLTIITSDKNIPKYLGIGTLW